MFSSSIIILLSRFNRWTRATEYPVPRIRRIMLNNPDVDKQVEKKLIDYLVGLEKTAGEAKEFIVEQAPLYVQEFLAWYFWSSILLAATGLLLFFVGFVYWKWFIPFAAKERDDYWDDERKVLSWVGLLIICGFGIGTFLIGVIDATKVSVAPRVVIVEELKDVLR